MTTTNETKSAEDLLFSHYLRTGERLYGEAAQLFLETKARAGERARQEKSAESVLFSHYLRTGERLYGEAAERFLERKFNQRHYVENGLFARAGEGQMYGNGSESGGGFRNGDGAMGRTRRVPPVHAEQTKPAKVPPKPQTPPSLPTRKEIIASSADRVRIQIRDNPGADASAPLYEVRDFEQVTRNDTFIQRSAQRHGVDPDLVRAIAYVESTHGYYELLRDRSTRMIRSCL